MSNLLYLVIVLVSLGVGAGVGALVRGILRSRAEVFLGAAGISLVLAAFLVSGFVGGPFWLPPTMLFMNAVGIWLGAFRGAVPNDPSV